jgi:signal transduction histidine kinase
LSSSFLRCRQDITDDPRTGAVAGSGLGLSLVDHIVRAHQGEIRIPEQGQLN